MEFPGDAFISYAHLDNVELVEGRKGWVANFHRALEVRVGQLLGKSPNIWRDPKLSGNDLFAETLIDRLKQVALLVSVVSPRYLKSEWTMRELNEFWHAAEDQGGIHVSNKARVFKVLKTPVPLDRTPPELRALIGYEFFKVDPETGKIRELDEVFGPDAHRDFWLKLDDLAHDIVDLLETMEHPQQPSTPVETARALVADVVARVSGDAVYVAETTSDLSYERDAIRRDLQQQGYVVLPDRTLPLVASEAESAIRADLARSRMSIHPIGRNYSLVPEGGSKSLVELQHELANERAAQGGFSRLIWIPRGLKVEDLRQLQVVDRLRMDPRMKDQADLLESYLEEFRTTMQAWLKAERPPAAGAAPAVRSLRGKPPVVYLIADERDTPLLGPWADGLFEQQLEIIQPVFSGDESEIREFHEDSLAVCDGVIILYGAGNELWLRRKLREIQKSPGYGRTKPQPRIAICLIGVRTPEKERFRTHEALVVPAWNGFSVDALRLYVTQLKAGTSV
jgi:hypothetical protein